MTTPNDDAEAARTVVASVPHHIDAKRWDELRRLFAAQVHTDYTSLFGGSPQTQSGDALVGGWQDTLGRVTTQHLLGPVTLDVAGDEARAACHVRALHHAPRAPGGDTWEVLGHYEMTLARSAATPSAWEITALTLHTFLQTGNAKLLQEAAAAPGGSR